MKYDNDIVTRSNSIAYSFFLSLFPTIIFLFTLLPLFPYTADYIAIFKDSTNGFIPVQAHEYLFTMIEGVASIKRSGLSSLGFLFAVIFSSSGMLTLMYGFHKTHEGVFKTRNYFKNRLVAILLTFLTGTLFLTSIFLIIFGQPLLEMVITKLRLSSYTMQLLNTFKWATVIAVIYTGITVIYRYGSAMRTRIKWVNTGAILATMLSIFSSLIFSFFINSFGRYNQIYGSIGALLVLMLWIQINVFVVLVGFEFNASIAVHKDKYKRKKIPSPEVR